MMTSQPHNTFLLMGLRGSKKPERSGLLASLWKNLRLESEVVHQGLEISPRKSKTQREGDDFYAYPLSKLQTSDFRHRAEKTGEKQTVHNTFLYVLYLFQQRSRKKNL